MLNYNKLPQGRNIEVLNRVCYANSAFSDPEGGELNLIFSSAEAEREGGLNYFRIAN